MAYSSTKGRRPIERASKISHAEIINNQNVRALLDRCTIPSAPRGQDVPPLTVSVETPDRTSIATVVAVDGGYRETFVREEFPSASVTFIVFGPLLFQLEDLRSIDAKAFIAPEDIERLKNIERFTLALPTRNVILDGASSLSESVRKTLFEALGARRPPDEPLIDALRWLIFREWLQDDTQLQEWTLPSCPNRGCGARGLTLRRDTPNESKCPTCGGPIYVTDVLRLHEVITDDQGAGGILGYLITFLEQLVIVHVIKSVLRLRPDLLREILFVKDGPLAFFGQTAPLHRPMRELVLFLLNQSPSGHQYQPAILNLVGIEKSGPFVEHAMLIEDHIPKGNALLLSDEYIYRYIVPGDATTQNYGTNTYYGRKLIYRSPEGSTYVVTVPTISEKKSPSIGDFPNLNDILSVLGQLRCSMYDNALIPIALANKLVSLSEYPGQRILEAFAREQVAP